MFRTSLAPIGSGRAAVRAASIALSLLLLPAAALAGDLGFKVEPGVAFPLTRPQSDRFDVGFGGAAKLLYGLGPYLDLTAGVSAFGLPRASGSPSTGTGTAWGYGGGLRLKRPHDALSAGGVSPWVDGDALYVRTGSLNRAGFAAAVGVAVPVGEARTFWVGPYVRYQQVFGRGSGAVDGRDAKVLLAGLSFEVGRSPMPRAVAQAAPAPAPVAVAAPVVVAKPDRDSDGTPDESDLCPDVAGPASNRGCPKYEKVVVTPEKLELKDKIQFAWDSPLIEPASHPALDEAVQALKDNPSFQVQIEGHASSEGGDEHNQTLSEARAKAVLDYLASHGVAQSRLSSRGFSSSVPLNSNTTTAGREANRRVEFVVHLVILKSGSGK
jgi:outer membrane protein OmpA-like peptidoglycan-associated protein